MSIIDINQLNREQLNALIAKAKASSDSFLPAEETVKSVGDTYPVSASQQSVWLVSQDAIASAAYNITVNLLITGDLNVVRLCKAFDQIVHRHVPLRTGYRFDPSIGRAQQFLCEVAPMSLNAESFQDREEWHQSIVSQFGQTLDIGRGEVYRAHLAKFEDQTHILSFEFHHIAFDGWSLGIFLQELRAFYLGEEHRLPALSSDYIDITLGTRGEHHDTALAYWESKLKAAPVTRLPADKPCTSNRSGTFQGAVVKHLLSADFTEKLCKRAKALGMSNFMFFSGALQYLVGRYNDTQESVIGSYVSGRDKTESQSLIGCFVNNIVLRQDWNESDSIQTFLLKIKATSLEALANQTAPFPEVVKQMGWQGDGHPIYQVGLVMQPESVALENWGETTLTALESESAYAHMDLEVYVWPRGDSFELVLNYDESRYSSRRMTWLIKHYERILDTLVGTPLNTPLQTISIVTADEEAVLNSFDARRVEYSDRLSSFAERLGDMNDNHIAIVVNDDVFSFGSLKQRIAIWLETFVDKELQSGDRVAFWGERGLDQQSFLAACVLYGLTYVPMDISLPETRCQQILIDAYPRLLVTLPERQLEAKQFTDVEVVACDPAMQPTHNFTSLCQRLESRKPNEEFALLYTSGTTGKPKGVSLSVQAANARLNFAFHHLTSSPSDRILQRTPLGFVDALWEVLDTMISGATSIVLTGNEMNDVSKISSIVNKHSVSKLYVVPSLLRMLCLGKNCLPSVRHLYSTAEPFSQTLLSEVKAAFPSAQIFDLYGSTEVNDVAWKLLCDRSVKHGYLGRVVEGAAIRVEDSFGRTMPIGCPGEIVVYGQQQLRNYTHCSNGSLSNDGKKETGFGMNDNAMISPDGQIKLLGRRDNMIKIRGNRVEVLEVQLALREVTGDSGAIVYFSPEQQTLIGCWVGQVCTNHIRQALLKILPNYMVPSQLYVLNSLPLLPHGKVNMQALKQKVAEARKIVDLQVTQEETEQEQALAAIYSRALQVHTCNIDANVFDLGLSSLELNQVQHDINNTMGLNIDIVTLLQYPTIRALAHYLFGSEKQTTKPARRGQRATRVRRRAK